MLNLNSAQQKITLAYNVLKSFLTSLHLSLPLFLSPYCCHVPTKKISKVPEIHHRNIKLTILEYLTKSQIFISCMGNFVTDTCSSSEEIGCHQLFISAAVLSIQPQLLV